MRANTTKTKLTTLVMLTMLLSIQVNAQTVVDVTAAGVTFTPTNVTIDVGDTVRWTNTSGTHNVNGTTVTFPGNPESFGNALGTGWVFTYVFNTAGSYDYQCDAHVTAGMTGTVTVVSASDIRDDVATSNKVVSKIYPIPSSEFVVIELTQEVLSANTKLMAVVYDLMGKEIMRSESITDAKITLNTVGWPNSSYVLHLMSDSKVLATEQIILQ